MDAFRSPAPELQTAPGSYHTEGANLESCCWPSYALATACTEPQRLGLCACLATSKDKYMVLFSWRTYEAQPPKHKRLQIAPTKKVLALKAIAGPHRPLLLLAQSQKYWGSLCFFPHPRTNIGAACFMDVCRSPAPKLQMSPDSSHTEGACLESYCWPSSVLDTAYTEPQRLCHCACLAT